MGKTIHYYFFPSKIFDCGAFSRVSVKIKKIIPITPANRGRMKIICSLNPPPPLPIHASTFVADDTPAYKHYIQPSSLSMHFYKIITISFWVLRFVR